MHRSLIQSDSKSTRLNGYIKIHKMHSPLILIVNLMGSTYAPAKFLTIILKEYINKASLQVVTIISYLVNGPNDLLVSFHVVVHGN